MALHRFLSEGSLAAFLSGTLEPELLNQEARSATEDVDSTRTKVFVRDMSSDFMVSAIMAVRLCDAALDERISPETLRILAFVIIASEHFEWNDELIAAVLHDISTPEINYPLTPANLRDFRRWLMREEPYPGRPSPRSRSKRNTIISELLKIPYTEN
jgi:hypothetical protein